MARRWFPSWRYLWRRYVLGIKPKPIMPVDITRVAAQLLREAMEKKPHG